MPKRNRDSATNPRQRTLSFPAAAAPPAALAPQPTVRVVIQQTLPSDQPASSSRQPLAPTTGNADSQSRVPEDEEDQRIQQPTVLYHKRSDSTNAERENPIQSFTLALQHLRPNLIRWNSLSPGDSRLRAKFDKMSASQRSIFHRLFGCLRTYVDLHIGTDNFDDCSRQWTWNWPTWRQILFKMAESIEVDVGGQHDCWFSTLSTDVNGRPKIPIRPGRIEKRRDGNHSRRNIFDFYQIEGCPGRLETTAARVAAVLRHGLPATVDLQASHLCHNYPQTCINPEHLVWESDRVNKSRNLCANGNALSCPHEITCIWTDIDGHHLPHRGLDFRSTPCDCASDCLVALTTRVARGDDG